MTLNQSVNQDPEPPEFPANYKELPSSYKLPGVLENELPLEESLHGAVPLALYMGWEKMLFRESAV